MGKAALDVSALTADEKFELIDDLWRSLSPDDFKVTPALRAELDRRLDRLDLSPVGTIRVYLVKTASCPRLPSPPPTALSWPRRQRGDGGGIRGLGEVGAPDGRGGDGVAGR